MSNDNTENQRREWTLPLIVGVIATLIGIIVGGIFNKDTTNEIISNQREMNDKMIVIETQFKTIIPELTKMKTYQQNNHIRINGLDKRVVVLETVLMGGKRE